MSDQWIRVIPTDPGFVPEAAAAGAGRRLLALFAPAGRTGSPARVVDAGKVVFIDSGSRFGSVACPWCSADIDTSWWLDRMGVAASLSFANLLTRTRCCDVTTSLNDLLYRPPQGFARWRLEVMNPDTEELSETQLEAIGAAVGHPVRAIYASI